MFNLRFFVGAPHAVPRVQIAEATSMEDCAWKALAEARPKAALIAQAIDASCAVTPGQGKLPLPPASIEIAVYKDDGQLALFDLPHTASLPQHHKAEWPASGDFLGHVELTVGEQQVEIATTQYAATTSAHALGRAVQTARTLVAELRNDKSLPSQVKRLITFGNVTVTVEQCNTQTSLLPIREEPRDWSSLTFPQPGF